MFSLKIDESQYANCMKGQLVFILILFVVLMRLKLSGRKTGRLHAVRL